MCDWESEESAGLRNNQTLTQSARGIKILTPNQILSQLSIASAKVQAGNNSQKLKTVIRQLLYSFILCIT